MRIAAWNLNHRTKEKTISLMALCGIKSVNADILVLTEYVDGPSRLEFKRSLADMGYGHISISRRITIHNQVLIASKSDQITGDIAAPDFTDAAKTNFLHCIFPRHGFELVGVRPPSYKSVSDRILYWQQLSKIMSSVASRPIIFVGDLNCDPFGKNTPGSTSLKDLMKLGYNIPNPMGAWSYISSNGNSSSRIDHAVASSSFGKCATSYICEEGSSIFAGIASKNPVSDHAILVVDCDCARARGTWGQGDILYSTCQVKMIFPLNHMVAFFSELRTYFSLGFSCGEFLTNGES